MADQEVEERGAEGGEIGASVHASRGDDLGRHVGKAALDRHPFGVESVGETIVSPARATVLVDEQVGGLHVSVKQPPVMEEVQTLSGRRDGREDLLPVGTLERGARWP